MATTTIDNQALPQAPPAVNPRSRSEVVRKQAVPMAQRSINRALSWTVGIALVLAIAGITLAVRAGRTSADALASILSKADKSDLQNYATKASIPAPANMRANPSPTNTNTDSSSEFGNQNNDQNGNNQNGPGNNQASPSNTNGQ